MKLETAYFSKQGREGTNEDTVLPPFNVQDIWWTAIADGMGGHQGGEIASRTVIQAVASAVRSRSDIDLAILFDIARNELQTAAMNSPELNSMGSTLSLIRLSNQIAEVGHVGDSRIYHLRRNGILDRTVDQTEVEQLVQRGVLNKARARHYPRRHVLLSVLSPDKQYELYRSTFDVLRGDRLILLTDGVSSKLLRQEIRDISLQQPTAQSFCDVLALEIEKRSPDDDYSAICIDIQ